MLNDKAMVKIVKQGNKKGKRLFIYNVDGNYYFSDTYGIYKFIPELHQKTGQEISKIFMGLPEEGKSFGIADKEKIDTVPNVMNMFFDAEKEEFEHELKATDYLKEVKGYSSYSGKTEVTTARILINSEFATLLDDEFFKVTNKHHILKCNGRHSAVCVFKENEEGEELLAFILPLKVKEPEKLDKLIAAA